MPACITAPPGPPELTSSLDLRSPRPGGPAAIGPVSSSVRCTSVLLATERELLGLGFGHVLHADGDLELVGVVRTVAEAWRAVHDGTADVVVIDVQLDGAGGLEFSRLLAETGGAASPHCFLVDQVDVRTVARLTRGGAAGFLHTTASAAQLRATLRHAARGCVVMDSITAHAVASDLLYLPPTGDRAELSERDLELLDLLADGRTNREIAATLFLSEKTVKNCLSSLFRKLGVRSRTEAALAATGAARAA